MMEIRRTDGLNGAGGAGRVEGSRPAQPAAPPAQAGAASGGDRVEISNVARLLSAANSLPSVRQDVIDRVKSELAGGRYETPDKIQKAVDRLLDDLGGPGQD